MIAIGHILCCKDGLRAILNSHSWLIKHEDSIGMIQCIYCNEEIKLKYENQNIEIITDINNVEMCKRI